MTKDFQFSSVKGFYLKHCSTPLKKLSSFLDV